MNLDDCLPPQLRGATITKIRAGLSGAGVYRVGDDFVLKITDEPPRLEVQRAAAEAGLAPRIVHVDEARHAVVMELVRDRGFAMSLFGANRDAAIRLLGTTLRDVHALPVPDAPPAAPLAQLADAWSKLDGWVVPTFVRDAVQRVRDTPVPPCDRVVASHNDVNPTNLIFDGRRLVLVDWQMAAPNDPYYDLAAAAVFFRFDEPALLRLLAAYDGSTVIPPRLVYDRMLVATMAGVVFLGLARAAGHPGGDGAPSTLTDFYARLRAGELQVSSPEGQWAFGLALVSAA